MKGTTNSQRGTGGGGEKLVISLKTNQTSHEDLIGAKFSVVISGNATEYTWQGASMTIPVTPMLNYTVEFGEVEGYAKPESVTHTAVAGNDRFVTGTYNTELVTVNVSAEEGEVSGYEIQIGKEVQRLEQISTRYTELMYIQSSGSQYINTGIGSNPNIRVWMDFALTDTSVGNQRLFGMDVGNGDSSLLAFCFYLNSRGYLSFACQNGTGSGVNTGLTADTHRRTVDMDSYNSVVNFSLDNGVTYTATMTGTRTVTSVYPMYLFCENRNGTSPLNYARMKLYACKIYDSGMLVRDYIPVKDSNGVAGLWDKVEKKFYSSATNTAFLAGYDVGELTYEDLVTSFEIWHTQTTPSATYKFPYATSYTIKASDVSGYTTPSEQSFTASQVTRNVDVTYGAGLKGVFIQDIYGRLYTKDEWDGTQTANGVVVLTDECEFVVAKEDAKSSSVYWGGYETDISTLTNYLNPTDAATDFDGVNNTSKIIAAIGNSNDGHRDGTAAGDCAAYIFPNGKTGYLGAAGEWQVARQNKEDLNNALTLIGGTTMTESYYWTSTECRSVYAWSQLFGSNSGLTYNRKDADRRYVRAFTPYIANPVFISFTIMTDGVNPESCVCRAGMTWGEWANSGYNTTLYYVSGTQIVQDYKRAHFQVRDNGVAVSTTDVIKETTYYAPFV